MQKKKVAIISIGNEILLGKTVNTNLAFLGTELTRLGFEIAESVTIPDEEEAIKHYLNKYVNHYDIVMSTGGLGPTKDDITKSVIAQFFNKELIFVDAIWEKINQMFAFRKMPIPEVNRNQALVPQDFQILENDHGTAPGLFYEKDQTLFFAMPGVPLEMTHLFTDRITPILKSHFALSEYYINTLNTYGISESLTAEILDDLTFDDDVHLAWLPQTGRVDIRVYGYHLAKCDQLYQEIKHRLKDYVWGENYSSLAEKLRQLLLSDQMTLSSAESCTGGLIQKLLTDQPGSSAYVAGGVVTYSNQAKQDLLKVKEETLNVFGAVSKECAEEMLIGLKKLFDTDFHISVTGIAGPDGGSDEKPVGLVYIGISFKDTQDIYQMRFIGTRDSIRFKVAEFVFYKMIKILENQ